MTLTRRRRAFGLGLGFVVVATAAQLVRQPGTALWNTMWAEDGGIYTTQALAHPAWKTLFRGYAGYAQLVPRMLALTTRVLPPAWWAPTFALAGTLITSLLALTVVRSARGWIDNPWLRWLLAFVVALSPVALSEITGNITNLNWTLFAVSFWLIASRQETTPDTVMRAGLVGLGALTTTLQVVMLPWAIVMAVLRRRRSDYVVLGALAVGLAGQGLAVHATTNVEAVTRPDLHLVVKDFVARVLGSAALGERWLPHWWEYHPRSVEIIAVAGLVAVVLLARPWRARPGQLLVAGGAMAIAVGVFAFSLWFRGAGAVELFRPGVSVPGGSRYAYPPLLFVLSGVTVLVDASGRAWLKILFAAQVLVIIVSSFSIAAPRSHGPAWSTEIERARAECRSHPTGRIGSAGSATVTIPITPFAVWHVTVPCDRFD